MSNLPKYIEEADVREFAAHVASGGKKGNPRRSAERLEQKVAYQIMFNNYTPNAPSTLARKSGTQPLYDTGRMAASIEGKYGGRK